MRFAILFVVLAGCPPAPIPLPPTDADAALGTTDPTGCAAACRNLARLGCAEGLRENCTPTCQHAQAGGLTDLRPGCLASASDRDAAHRCGTVACSATP